GEEAFNDILSEYVDSVAFQYPPYTTSEELVGLLKARFPDSLQYVITDMMETITLYNNRVTDVSYEELDDGRYEVSMTTTTSKYRTGDRGRRQYKNESGDSLSVVLEGQKRPVESLPLADYIDIGVFGTDDSGEETILYLERKKISDIQNKWSIVVDDKPVEVGIDPYNKLIDTNSEDNRQRPTKR
ncbi:MAG: hypothetical protein AAFQ02_13125, partial [Bacteroidota bacterium]